MLALLGRDFLRQLHVDRGIEIAMLLGLAGRRHPVALQPEHLRVLGGRRNLEAKGFAAKRLHFSLAPEHRRGQRNRHARVEISSFALELRMRRLLDPQIEIAWLRAARARLALAGDAHTRAVADAGRNPHIDRARLAIVLDREAAHRALVQVVEPELELLFDVASGAGRRAGAARPSRTSPRLLRTRAAAKEGLKEIGERVR